MKVNGFHAPEMHGAAVRAPARAAAATSASLVEAAAPAASTGTAAATTAAATATSAVESTLDMAARRAPPGLLRVAAKLEALGADGRSGGQSNALAQITRNLQRYAQAQDPAPPSATTPTPPTADTTTTGPAPPSPPPAGALADEAAGSPLQPAPTLA